MRLRLMFPAKQWSLSSALIVETWHKNQAEVSEVVILRKGGAFSASDQVWPENFPRGPGT